jgi:hypothetical protein
MKTNLKPASIVDGQSHGRVPTNLKAKVGAVEKTPNPPKGKQGGRATRSMGGSNKYR